MSCRHARQRSNRVRLKADAVVLLDRITALWSGELVDDSLEEDLAEEIAEMRVRLAPKPGVAAPIVLTDYTTKKRKP